MSNPAQLFETENRINDTLLDKERTFSSNEFNLDRRLVRALSNMGFVHPTIVQSQCIPRLLEGKDLLVKADTGSGKTIAYGIPILQKLLSSNIDRNNTDVKVLILAPSRELCLQTRDVFKMIMKYVNDLFTCQVLEDGDVSIQKARLLEHPDILISTPYLLVKFLNMKAISISNINTLVIDEADLTLSYGYEEDMKVITNSIPTICQSILMSATLNEDVSKLRKGLLTNEVVIKVGQESKNINQYYITVKNRDEDILIFALLKLHVIQGKILFFVNSIDRCYYLKLFFEQFSIPSAVLNSELPVKSRENIIQQFNRGKFDYLIATDESLVSAIVENPEKEEENDEDLLNDQSEEDNENQSDHSEEVSDDEIDELSDDEEKEDEIEDSDDEVFDMSGDSEEESELDEDESKEPNKEQTETEYDVSRGIDFKNVACVINYDFPLTKDSYIHRIGRTARAGNTGIALSILHTEDQAASTLLKTLQTVLPLNNGIPQPSPLPFNMSEVEAFRYRVEDVRRAVTRVAIKESRIKEIQQELYNSKLLQSHFEDNPQELNLLHHARPLLPRRVKSYLKDIPDYLIPESLKPTQGFHSYSSNGGRRNIYIKRKKNDPLQSFAMTMETLKTAPRIVNQESNGKDLLSGRNLWKLRHHKGMFKHGFHKGMTAAQGIKKRALDKHGGKEKYGRQR